MGLRFHLARRRVVATLLVAAFLIATTLVAQAEPRMWRDPSGKFRFKAELLELGADFVRLKKTDGSVVRLSFDDLSAADRIYLVGHTETADPPKAETPAPMVAPAATPEPAPPIAPGAPAQALPDLIERIEQSVVRVYGKVKDGEARGSGVLIDDAGHIVTNHHVIQGTSKVEIEFQDGTRLPILGCCRWDDPKDVAILLVDQAKLKVKPLPLLDALPRKGEHVLTIGAPLGLEYTVSQGNISAIRTGRELAKISPEFKSLAAESHWIQITAPISSGNSGGPLVDMQGRVIGLNTMGSVVGQNLNFAVSSKDVLDEFQKIDGDFVPLPNAPAESIGTAEDPTIVLPSGTLVDIDAIFLDGVLTGDLDDQFPRRTPIWILSFNSGRPRALVMHNHGRLHGRVLGLYETGVTATIATYDDSSRHGNLLTWTPTGEKSVFAQYARGKLHGILCRFKDDNLSLVQEYKAGQLVSSHLVAGGDIVKNYVPADMPPELDEELAAAHTELEEALATLAENEADFRRAVMKLEQQFRRLIASAKSVDARSKIQSREDDRRAAFGGAIADLQQRMGTRP